MPDVWCSFTPPEVPLEVGPLPALSMQSANGVTFGSFNNLAKMNDEVVALWARVLHAVSGSRLFLKTKQLNDLPVRTATERRFAAHGIDTSRLILEGSSPRHELLGSYRRVDIGLDPFPYGGGTTGFEILWMGVPFLTLKGYNFLSRCGESLATNAGLTDWIAVDADDYVTRAVRYAADLQGLAALRSGLRQQVLASPLFDAPRFARHFEAALRGMWTRWCERQHGQAAAHPLNPPIDTV
jgi:predicted O-linked N-acetylglucosamine transferase (SPINDLY family)